jgi:muconolactone D-isomerase
MGLRESVFLAVEGTGGLDQGMTRMRLLRAERKLPGSTRPLEQIGAILMDYLVDFTLTVPEGTRASELEQRTTGEGTRVAELAAQGHALRVWKPLPDDGRSRAIGLYRAADDSELQAILESLPLWPWMEISVTALAEHPNDPARECEH